MDLSLNLIPLIDALGLFQGVILGLLLIIINKKKDRSTLFLGLFIIAYALELLPGILFGFGIANEYPVLKGLPLNFNWFLFPLFYIYVQEISIFSKSKNSYWVLYPGITFFILNMSLFVFQIDVTDSDWYTLLDFGGILFSVYIGFKTLSWIKKHIKEVSNQYSTTEFKDLHWARLFVILGLAFTLTVIVLEFIEMNSYINILISVINIVLLYWISIRGILQQNVPTLIAESSTQKKELDIQKLTKEESSKNIPSQDLLLSKIETYILSNNAFTQPDLTITDIANGISEHPKRISGIINSSRNQNFNAYINQFRVEKAMSLLKSDVANNLSIEGIANEVGFHSRSSFYTAFKKVTNTTPSQFKKA